MAFLFTEARLNSDCPKCKAKPGEYCKTPKGREATYPHNARVIAFTKSEKYNANDFTVGRCTLHTIFERLNHEDA